MSRPETSGEIFRAKINLETSKIAWTELQRFFAGGRALMVSPDLDLVEVAFQIAEDNVEQIRQCAAAGKLSHVPDEQAREWAEDDALVWAVVVSPWVLVQPMARLQSPLSFCHDKTGQRTDMQKAKQRNRI